MANAQINLKISEIREGKALTEVEGDINRVGEALEEGEGTVPPV